MTAQEPAAVSREEIAAVLLDTFQHAIDPQAPYAKAQAAEAAKRILARLEASTSVAEQGAQVYTEPFLPADLEDGSGGEDTTEWHARVLRALAAQLGFGNDYYYPLLGAASHLETEAQAAPLPAAVAGEPAADAAEVERRTIERCAQIADEWSKASYLKLAVGEMKAQEQRTAIAVANGIGRRIRALLPESGERR